MYISIHFSKTSTIVFHIKAIIKFFTLKQLSTQVLSLFWIFCSTTPKCVCYMCSVCV